MNGDAPIPRPGSDTDFFVSSGICALDPSFFSTVLPELVDGADAAGKLKELFSSPSFAFFGLKTNVLPEVEGDADAELTSLLLSGLKTDPAKVKLAGGGGRVAFVDCSKEAFGVLDEFWTAESASDGLPTEGVPNENPENGFDPVMVEGGG